MMTKTQLMALVATGAVKEAYTFVPSDGSPERNYDVSLLREGIRAERIAFTVATVPMSQLADPLSATRVWEQRRVDALTPESYELDPPIFLYDSTDDTHMLVDGIHRIMRLFQLGREEVHVVVVAEPDAPRVAAGWGQLSGMDWGAPLSSLRAR